ncbi:MAG: cold-shock protein [Saprospiraceae bacterium]|nr:cold-shock protein [Candidatus Vicinibacter affinis]
MKIGLINWFDDDKGFGILKTPDNNEVFLHISNWKDVIKFSSSNYMPILFKIGFLRNKKTALNCEYFKQNSFNHWEKVLSLKDNNYNVKIRFEEVNLLELIISKLMKILTSFILKFLQN